MKKVKRIVLALVAAATLFGCKNQIEVKGTTDSSNLYDNTVVDFYSKTIVELMNGVSAEDIGKTTDGYLHTLKARISDKVGREVYTTESVLKEEDIINILKEKVDNADLPELINPSESDIARIALDFPELAEDEILENLEIIIEIYQSEIASLAIDEIVDLYNSSTITSARALSDYGVIIKDDIISLAEVAACLKHPISACSLITQKEKAFELTEKYMGYAESVDEKSDAFRHAIWNVVMAKEGWGFKDNKIAWAKDFSTAHEQGIKYDGLASEMDSDTLVYIKVDNTEY